MTSNKARSDELRIQNVRMHRQGLSAELGTLSLARHHLIFSYVPCDTQETGRRSTSHAPAIASQTVSGSKTSTDEVNGAQSGTSTPIAKPRRSEDRLNREKKTIWIPYPMVQRCVLRPSHLQGYSLQSQSQLQSQPQSYNDRDSLDTSSFPPTFGTGSFERPSTDSARLAPYSSPRRPTSPAVFNGGDGFASRESGRSPALRIRCRDFRMMAFHFHPASGDLRSPDEIARDVFFRLRTSCCPERLEDMLAFHFSPPQQELSAAATPYDARKEFARMGIGEKAAEGPGMAWRISDINRNYSFAGTYPAVLCVPRAVSDNMLKYGAVFRSKARIPALAYLHFNGGSITRCSQPLVGLKGKRNPQDEKLVSAIFSSHTPTRASPEDSPPQLPSEPSQDAEAPTLAEQSSLDAEVASQAFDKNAKVLEAVAAEGPTPVKPRVYGSTRSNLIVDARPIANMVANKFAGGGIEDVTNYRGTAGVPVEKVFLNIENIHAMRKSLQRVVESLGNADYVNLPPDQGLLRKSKWLDHIANLIDGSEIIARAVGLAGSHVLTHCSDGWDRTSQVSALAQVMLDPHYRTLNGFITLIQKDFLSFGHKFRDRDCVQGVTSWFEIENERIAPGDSKEHPTSDSNSLNNIGSKALSSARNWFEKSREGIFRKENSADDTSPRPPSPPPNPVIHSPPTANSKEEKKHGTKEDEMAPIFHQFLECVYDLQRQYPSAFEYNERFLLRLLYQTYACQYGEFMFNSEQERMQHQSLPSVWPFFLARRREMLNPEYTPEAEKGLLLPKRGSDQKVEVWWWSKLFGREDAEMNIPRTHTSVVGSSADAQASTMSLDQGARSDVPHSVAGTVDTNGPLREARSTPNFSLTTVRDSLMSSFAGSPLAQSQASTGLEETGMPAQRPPLHQQETDVDVLATYSARDADASNDTASASNGHQTVNVATGQDPLGANDGGPTVPQSSGLDFAAFASQNAFRDR